MSPWCNAAYVTACPAAARSARRRRALDACPKPRQSASWATSLGSVRHAVRMTVISVMLIVPDADGAVAWYRTALGATERWNLGGVAGLEINGAPFFLHQ